MWSAVNRLQGVPPLSPTIPRVAAPIAIVEGQARPIAWERGAADFRFHNSACRGPSHRGPRIDCARPARTPIDGRRLLRKPRAKGLHIGGLSPLLRANETIAAARRQGQVERRDQTSCTQIV